MCMSDPARVIEVRADGEEALVEMRGTRRRLSIALLTLQGETVEVDDWVLAGAGIAYERIDEQEAAELETFMRAARGEEETG
jgi:hydrogenase assembly chaperone HypC/HupF